MLPGNRCVYRWMMVVSTPDPEGGEHAAAAAAREVGRGRPGRAGAALRDHPRRRDPHPLPDGPAERPGPCRRPDRPAGPPQPRHRPARAQALPGPRSGRGPAPAPSRAATPLPARLGTGTGPGGRPGPPRGRGRQRAVDLPAAGRLPGRADRPPGRNRDGQDRAASRRVCVQAAPLGAVAQGPGPAGVGKKRLRVEALLAAAASPVPPPASLLVPDATLADDLFPADLPRLLELLARADLYLQDEVELALHPTLTRVCPAAAEPASGWSRPLAPTPSGTASGWSTGATVSWTSPWPRAAAPRRCAPSCAAPSSAPRPVAASPW